ncbi:MAG: hypothetical protein LQ337_001999 [Flavoplaca oasis]|nr:MAG: hypothetical protein LQ337_001999 [Flavoplaca oasis]
MADDYFRVREKRNALEWQVKEEPGVHQGNTINSYFNQDSQHDLEEDRLSEPHSEAPAVAKTRAADPQKPGPQAPTTRKTARTIGPNNLPRRQKITLSAKQDNAAKIAFRNNTPPTQIVDMGRPIQDIEPNVGSIPRIFEQIGLRTGSFILPQRSLGESQLQVWGNPKQVSLAVNELKAWRYQANKRAASSTKGQRLGKDAFAGNKSFIGSQYAADERIAKLDAQRHEYQKVPEPGTQFRYNGYFLWPNDEIRATDLFGPSCEALDPLRMEYRVYIIFDEARSVFKVFSNSSVEKIYAVIQRIENTIKEFVARDDRPMVLYLIEPPMTDKYRDSVRMVPGPLIGPSRTPSRIPQSCGNKLEPIDVVDWELEANKSASRNQIRMSTAISKVLERIPYIRGHLRMRAQFGTFTLIKFQWPPGVSSVPLTQFETDVQSAGTRGTLIRDLQLGRPARDVLHDIHHAVNLFQTIGASDDSLATIPPQYTAMFYLRHPDKAEEMIQLEVDFKTDDAGGEFEPSKALWRKASKPDAVSQAAPLEASNVRLHSGVSWQLKISADNLVDPSRITSQMETFASGIEYKKPPPETNPAVSGYKIFTSPGNFAVLGTEQRTTFRYSLKKQARITVEIQRYDVYDGDNPRLPSTTQWALSLYDREWDLKLSENAKLGVGHAASWNPSANPFFTPIKPSASGEADAGFKDFLGHTQDIGEFLDGLKADSREPATATSGSTKDGQPADERKEDEQQLLF